MTEIALKKTEGTASTAAIPAKAERPKEQDLNSFEKIIVNRNDPEFKGKWVGLGYKITQITELDDGNNTFNIEFFLYPTWEEKSLIGGEKGKKYTLEELPWEPKIKFKNELGYEVISSSFWLSDPATGTIDSSMRFRGKFFEHLELQNFPFDKQDLRLFIDSFYHFGNMRFYQREDRPNSFAAHRFPLSEWAFEEDSCEMKLSTVASGNKYYNYVINCPIRRLHEYYVHNTLLSTFMILSMGVGTFLFDNTSIDNRLNFVVTLALTGVAFKFLMMERLPKVPYSTILDKFLYLVFAIIVGIAMLVIVIGAISQYGSQNAADHLNLAGLFFFAGAVLLTYAFALLFVQRRDFFIKDTANY